MRAPTRSYWTTEEDAVLLRYVHSFQGKVKWSAVSRSLRDEGIRKSANSCSQRYNNHLAEGLVKRDFTDKETDVIKRLMAKWGNRWEFIASHFPGRTGNSVKNWHHKQLAKQARDRKRALNTTAAALPQHPAGGPSVGVSSAANLHHGEGTVGVSLGANQPDGDGRIDWLGDLNVDGFGGLGIGSFDDLINFDGLSDVDDNGGDFTIWGNEWELASPFPGRSGNSVKNRYHKQLARDRKRALPTAAAALPQHPGVSSSANLHDGEGPTTLGVSVGANLHDGEGGDCFGGYSQQFLNNGRGGAGFWSYNNQQFLNNGGAGAGGSGFWSYNNRQFLNNGGVGASVGGVGFGDYNQQFLNNGGVGAGFWSNNNQQFLNNGGGGYNNQQFLNNGGASASVGGAGGYNREFVESDDGFAVDDELDIGQYLNDQN